MTTHDVDLLGLVFVDLIGSIKRGELERAKALLAPDVVWQGLRPEWRCDGADMVIETLAEGIAGRPDIDAVELLRGPEAVVFGSRGASLDAIDDLPLGVVLTHVVDSGEVRLGSLPGCGADARMVSAGVVGVDPGSERGHALAV
jgi:hypothetical protein